MVRTLIATIVVVGIRMRMGMFPGLHDCAGVIVAVLESGRVCATENDPDDY